MTGVPEVTGSEQERLDESEAVEVRHHDVGQHEVRSNRTGRLKSSGTVPHGHDVVGVSQQAGDVAGACRGCHLRPGRSADDRPPASCRPFGHPHRHSRRMEPTSALPPPRTSTLRGCRLPPQGPEHWCPENQKGRRTVNVLPSPSSLVAAIEPPWRPRRALRQAPARCQNLRTYATAPPQCGGISRTGVCSSA